jgi:hypothetical protein
MTTPDPMRGMADAEDPDDAGAIQRLRERGFAIADEDAMSRAIHGVYCGPSPDHDEPNAKDQDQARAMLDALRREIMTL